MQRAAGLAAGALAAALLLGTTGTTTAAWRDDAPVPGATLAAGTLDVTLHAAGDPADPVVLEPGAEFTATYDLGAELHGDNLDAVLRLSAPAWQDSTLLDVLEITAVVEQGGTTVATGTLDTEGVFRFDGAPDVPVELPHDAASAFGVTLTVAMDAQAGNQYQGLRLDDGELVADLWQARAGETAADADLLWSDSAAAAAPPVTSGTLGVEVTRAPQDEADDPRQDDLAEPTEPTEPDNVLDATSDDGSAEVPDDDTAPAPEPGTTPDPEPTEPAGGAPSDAAEAPPADGAAEPGHADTEPAWAEDLLDLLEQAGIDPDDVDPAELPDEVEEWSTVHEIPLDDVRAWFEGRAS